MSEMVLRVEAAIRMARAANKTGEETARAAIAATKQEERNAFMAAIVKLADDAEFRRSFMTHYQQWLYPPLLVPAGHIEKLAVDMRPGAMTPVTEEQLRKLAAGEMVCVPQ